MAATWSAISHSRVSRPFPSSASKREEWVLIPARRGVLARAIFLFTTRDDSHAWSGNGRCNSKAVGASAESHKSFPLALSE